MKIILGSSSKWRQGLMHTIVPEFDVMEPGIDESAITHPNPQLLTLMLAIAKSKALRPRITEPAILVTSDQVVVWGDIIRGKPKNALEAQSFLRSYRQHPAECVTAVLAYNTVTGYDNAVIDCAFVHFKNLTEEAIRRIIEHGLIFTCAGGFAAGDPSFEPYVDRIAGTIDSVMGLPLELTRTLIAQASQ